jgi:hypothetical protein
LEVIAKNFSHGRRTDFLTRIKMCRGTMPEISRLRSGWWCARAFGFHFRPFGQFDGFQRTKDALFKDGVNRFYSMAQIQTLREFPDVILI